MLLNILTFLYLIPAPPQVDNVVTIPLPLPQVVVMPQDERLYDEFWGDAYLYADEGDTLIRIERVSFYNPVPEQTTPNPEYSSCGKTLDRQIAVDRGLFFDAEGRKHLCGRVVTVVTDRGEVFENYVLNDTMNARFTEPTVDVMLPADEVDKAMELGVTTGTLIIRGLP